MTAQGANDPKEHVTVPSHGRDLVMSYIQRTVQPLHQLSQLEYL